MGVGEPFEPSFQLKLGHAPCGLREQLFEREPPRRCAARESAGIRLQRRDTGQL
jgi:hypothetical protein